MSNQLVPLNPAAQARAALPAHLQQRLASVGLTRELGEGITSGFAIVSIRGKAWRIKHRGEERILYNADGRTPRYTLNVVLVKASANISKIWYEHGYVEGSNSPPDCWSVDGKVPDRASPKLQNATCAGCQWNAWGSSRTQGGTGKGKDCADSKRLAIVPAGDVENEIYGGPMLLRIPPASLGELGNYDRQLASMGYNLFEVETEMSFDPNAEYPRVMFRAIGTLDGDRLEKVMDFRVGPTLDRMLSQAIEAVHTDGVDETHTKPVPATPGQQGTQRPPTGLKLVSPTTAPEPAPEPFNLPSNAAEQLAGRSGLSTEEAAKRFDLPEPIKPDLTATPIPQVDPRLQGLIAAGLSGEMLVSTAKALGIPMPGAAPEPAPAQPAPQPEPEPVKPPLPPAPPAGNDFAPPPAQAAPEPAPKPRRKPAEVVKAEPAIPAPAEAAQAPSEAGNAEDGAGSIPADFDSMLSKLL